jgi:hypothetical protein
MTTDRKTLAVIGECIGTYAIRRCSETAAITEYQDFRPLNGLMLPPGLLNIDWEAGELTFYSDDGEASRSYKIATVLEAMKG